jgi:hypothetical protein
MSRLNISCTFPITNLWPRSLHGLLHVPGLRRHGRVVQREVCVVHAESLTLLPRMRTEQRTALTHRGTLTTAKFAVVRRLYAVCGLTGWGWPNELGHQTWRARGVFSCQRGQIRSRRTFGQRAASVNWNSITLSLTLAQIVLGNTS